MVLWSFSPSVLPSFRPFHPGPLMAQTSPKKNLSRRDFLKWAFLAVSSGASVSAYGAWVETEWLDIHRVTVPIFDEPPERPMRLLHLSDFHASPVVSYDYIETAIDAAITLKPDVICLTGDYITGEVNQPEEYARILRKLSQTAPCFASFGNHDGGRGEIRRGGFRGPKAVNDILTAAGITTLFNRGVDWRWEGHSIRFIGLADLWSKYFQPDVAYGEAENWEGRKIIVLSHNPDTKSELAAYPWQLLLCGHTHGGQVRIPFTGRGLFAPVRDKRFVDGLYDWDNRWIYITRGIGNVKGFRLNCRPWISLLEIV